MRVEIQMDVLFGPQCELVYQDYHERRLYREARGRGMNMSFGGHLSWVREEHDRRVKIRKTEQKGRVGGS